MRQLRIAIVVHGRFHAFDLARELHVLGHDVTVFTNYPAFVAARFGIPRKRVRSFLGHGIISRLAEKIVPSRWWGHSERVFNTAFGRWAAAEIASERVDVIHSFSGVSEEIFRSLRNEAVLLTLARGSTHVVRQRQLLEEEQLRAGTWISKPSDWIMQREQREYDLADVICVLGEYAYQSFVELGVPVSRLCQLRSGVQTARFRASAQVTQERQHRTRSDGPLHVLNVGTFCLRKGALDFAELIRQADANRFRFRFVGAVSADALHLKKALEAKAEFRGKQPQELLPVEYAWGDVFLLPTIEEGFATVLPQALASGLPVITTPNSGAGALVRDGHNGWLLPPRCPGLFLEKLQWCDQNREGLATLSNAALQDSADWDWSMMARQAERCFYDGLNSKSERITRNSVEEKHRNDSNRKIDTHAL